MKNQLSPESVATLLGHPLVTMCSHCQSQQGAAAWGITKCRNLSCQKEFDAKYEPEKILLELFEKAKREALVTTKKWRSKEPKLQRLASGGYVLVPQGGELV